MRIGVMVAANSSVEAVVGEVDRLATRGLHTAWLPQLLGIDALTAIAVVGQRVSGIELGTAVVATYPRHPIALAQQALTAREACGGRLTLGIGVSHRFTVEGMFGLSFDRPARHMSQYLDVLLPLLREGSVDAGGDLVRGRADLTIPADSRMQVLLAALAPRMIELAGGRADGTITWMTGLRTLGAHVVPGLDAAAAVAHRPASRVVVGLPVAVTGDPDGARAAAAAEYALYGRVPSYRAMLDREGAAGPEDVVIVGDEAEVASRVRAYAGAGATDFLAALWGPRSQQERTLALLSELAAAVDNLTG